MKIHLYAIPMGNIKAKLAAKANLEQLLGDGVLRVEDSGTVVVTNATGGTARKINKVLESSQVVGKNGPAVKEKAVHQLQKGAAKFFPGIDLAQDYDRLVVALREQTAAAVNEVQK